MPPLETGLDDNDLGMEWHRRGNGWMGETVPCFCFAASGSCGRKRGWGMPHCKLDHAFVDIGDVDAQGQGKKRQVNFHTWDGVFCFLHIGHRFGSHK